MFNRDTYAILTGKYILKICEMEILKRLDLFAGYTQKMVNQYLRYLCDTHR